MTGSSTSEATRDVARADRAPAPPKTATSSAMRQRRSTGEEHDRQHQLEDEQPLAGGVEGRGPPLDDVAGARPGAASSSTREHQHLPARAARPRRAGRRARTTAAPASSTAAGVARRGGDRAAAARRGARRRAGRSRGCSPTASPSGRSHGGRGAPPPPAARAARQTGPTMSGRSAHSDGADADEQAARRPTGAPGCRPGARAASRGR